MTEEKEEVEEEEEKVEEEKVEKEKVEEENEKCVDFCLYLYLCVNLWYVSAYYFINIFTITIFTSFHSITYWHCVQSAQTKRTN